MTFTNTGVESLGLFSRSHGKDGFLNFRLNRSISYDKLMWVNLTVRLIIQYLLVLKGSQPKHIMSSHN